MRILQIVKELFILALKTKPWKKASFASKTNAVLIRKSLERLGSVFIKFGQMLALRPDFVPEVFCEEFYKLLDKVPPFSSDEAIKILKHELGNNFAKLLDFEVEPLASASFAQVHKAKFETGEVIAVKIQRPGIEKVVKRDLVILKFLANAADFFLRPANKFSEIVSEFEAWTKDELDYVLEAENVTKFNEFSKLVGDGIRGPKVYQQFSTSKILTMEYIEGYSLTQIIDFVRKNQHKKLKQIGFEGKEVIGRLIKNMLEMAHIHGFFHADPHPANIILTPEKELVFIDFGIVGNLSKKERTLILRYFRAVFAGNTNKSFNSLLELCGGDMPENINEIKQKHDALMKQYAKTFDAKTYLELHKRSGHIQMDAIKLLQESGIKVPIGIVRYLKNFETLEGLIFILYPEFQVKDMLKEFRRVSIINIVDAIPTKFDKKSLDGLLLKFIDSIERTLLLSD